MKAIKLSVLALSMFFGTAILTSCDDEEDTVEQAVINPIELGAQVLVNNTIELAVYSVPETPFVAVGDSTPVYVVEGVDFTIFSYEVDVTETSVTFSIPDDAVSNPDAPFRIIEDGTYDRYYFTFTPAQNITSATADVTGLSTYVIDGDEFAPEAQLLIEIGPGFNFDAGISFTVELN